ncbi:MAG: endonuclease/exonuclease/phosphatase family protein [Bacteroidia bacterium]
MKTFKLFKLIFFYINIFFAGVLLLSYLSPYVSPNDFWPLAFLALAYPFLAPINILFILAWIVMLNIRFTLSLTVLLIGSNHVVHYIQFNAKRTEKKPSMINVVQFNTHFMGAFDKKNNDTLLFFNTLKEIDPDIICFQEFANQSGSFDHRMFVKFFQKYQHFYSVNADKYSEVYPTGYGVCIFSKYPVVQHGFLEQVNRSANLSLYADVDVNGQIIRVVNTHLRSISFQPEDYIAVEGLKEKKASISSMKMVASKMRYAFERRAKQAEALRQKLNQSPYPLIVCGDFNDSPTSYAYTTVKGDLKDAFRQSGIGMSRTYIGRMPSFRIDYILHDNKFKSYNYRTHELNFSDHKMICCTIDLATF